MKNIKAIYENYKHLDGVLSELHDFNRNYSECKECGVNVALWYDLIQRMWLAIKADLDV